jgi:hypothetical protein
MANAIVAVDVQVTLLGRNRRTESPVHLILYEMCTNASETHVFLEKIKVRSHEIFEYWNLYRLKVFSHFVVTDVLNHMG